MIPATAEQERALIGALREGKEDAKRVFYEQFYLYLAAVCMRYVQRDEDVKDLLQDIFLKIFTCFNRFAYRGSGSLQAWSHQIAVNESLMYLRKRRRHPTVPIEWHDKQYEDDDDYTEDPSIEDIPPQVLLEMIRRLPDRYRTVFNLFIFENKSHREIAALLHIKEDSSASNLHRAKVLLSKWIKDYLNHNTHGR